MTFSEINQQSERDRLEIVGPSSRYLLYKYGDGYLLMYYRDLHRVIQEQAFFRVNAPERRKIIEYYKRGYL